VQVTVTKWLQAARHRTFFPAGGAPGGLVRTLIAGVTAAVSGLFLSRLLNTVANVLIVRRLGVTLYGEYASLMVSLGLLASLLGLGLDTWLLQEGGRDPANLARSMRQVLAIKTITAAILLAVLAVVWSNQIVEGPAFVIGALSIIFDSFSQTGYSALRARRRNTQVAVFQAATPLLLLLVLFTLQRSALNVLLLVSIQAACSLTIALLVLTRVWPLRALSAPANLDLLGAIRKGWLFVASEGLSNIYARSGIAILGATAGAAAVGIFNPAVNLVQLTYMVPNLLFVVGLPLLMAPDTSPREYWRVIRVMLAGALAYGLGAGIVMWFFGGSLIRILYGSEFAPVLPLIQTMSLMPLLKACSFVWVAIMLAHLEQRLRVIVQALTVLVSLPAGLLIVPAAGAEGAAWLYVGIEALLCALYGLGAWWVTRRGRR
jgi:O-antigen/teichoic acid export membrane protein